MHPPQADGRVNGCCSRVCCTTTLQQVLAAKRRFPDLTVFDFHQDIRTYGRGHEDCYRQASLVGIVFFRFHGNELPVVESGRNGTPLQVRLKGWLTWGEEVGRGGQSIIRAKVNPDLRVGCGACVAVCPTRESVQTPNQTQEPNSNTRVCL